MHDYKAELVRVIDGDTVKLTIDVGFRMNYTDNFRLARINTPELKNEEYEAGHKAKNYLESLLKEADLTVETIKHGKFRWIIELYIDGFNVNDIMVDTGYAVYKDY